MDGRGTDDDDTHERHTDTHKLTRHSASWAHSQARTARIHDRSRAAEELHRAASSLQESIEEKPGGDQEFATTAIFLDAIFFGM